MESSRRIELVAQGIRRTPTGYFAHCDEEAQEYEAEMTLEDVHYDCIKSMVGDDIWLMPIGSSFPSVPNMACMLLTGQAVYDSVAFFKYDREKEIIRNPTLEEIKPVMDLLQIKYSETEKDGIEFCQ